MREEQKHEAAARRKSQANPSTFKERDDWMRAVLASDLPDAVVRVAMTMALHLRVKTGQCNPSYPTLARESHVGERSAYRLVAMLEHTGWIAIQRTRGRLSNQYTLRNPANTMSGLNRANPAKSMSGSNPAKSDSNPAKSTRQPCQQAAGEQRNSEESSLSMSNDIEREAGRETFALSREEIPSGGGAPPADAGPSRREEGEAPTAASSLRQEPPIERSCSVAREDRFGELRARWRRGWPGDDTPKAIVLARQAFERACREGADPGEIIAAAKTWITAADAPRFLPPLPQWLDARGWEQPPPTKPKRARGNGKGHRSYGPPDMFKILLEEGGYREDADGNLYWPGDDGEPISTMSWRIG